MKTTKTKFIIAPSKTEQAIDALTLKVEKSRSKKQAELVQTETSNPISK